MADEKKSGPDLSKGVPLSSIPDGGSLLGHAGDEAVLTVRQGAEVFAIGAECSPYHGPLAEGVVTNGEVRCPWHHACFDIRTGEALRAPAFNAVACWKVEQQDGNVIIHDKIEPKPRPRGKPSGRPDKIIIVGGGAAGFAAAEMLRRQDYQAASSCSAMTTRRRSTARTSPRTISPAARRRTGCRCARTTSTRRATSICGSRPRSQRSIRAPQP